MQQIQGDSSLASAAEPVRDELQPDRRGPRLRRLLALLVLFGALLLGAGPIGCDAETQKTAQTGLKAAKKSKGYVKRIKATWNRYAGKYGVYLAVGLIIVGLLLLAIFIWWMRRRKDQADLPPIPDFAGIWSNFLDAIPGEFAYCIDLYQHFITIGESGSGKSLAIDLYTDWQGQARQFYPSYSTDPDLQCFLGSQVVVQELPAPQLENTDPRLRDALLKHWRRLYKARDPIVVVTVRGPSLIGMTPETLKRQAQLIRGKINILAQIRRSRIETRVVLTHMDELEGFSEFTRYLRQHRVPFAIQLKSTNDVDGIQESLTPYEQYLTRILTHLPGQDYMKVLSYFQTAPDLLERAGEFVRILTRPDPLSETPAVDEIFLGAATQQPSSPFHRNADTAEIPFTQRPSFKHRLACGSVLALALSWMAYTFIGERLYWQGATDAVETFYREPRDGRDLRTLTDTEVLERIDELELFGFLQADANPYGWGPDYHRPEWQKRVVDSFLTGLRERYLLPKLRHFLDGDSGAERSIYLLALLYSSADSELGARILKEQEDWSRRLTIEPEILRAYVENSAAPWSKRDLPEVERVLERVKGINSERGFTRWLVFLERLEPMIRTGSEPSARQILLQSQLEDLQLSAKALRDNFEETRRWILALKLCRSKPLKSLPAVKLNYERLTTESDYTRWITDHARAIDDLLSVLMAAKIDDFPATRDMHLARFMRSVQAIRSLPRAEERRLEFKVGVESFKVDIGLWNRLVMRSRLKGFLSAYMAEVQRDGSKLFFDSRSIFPEIALNPTNDGTFVYEGQVTIPGRYTREAYEKQVLEPFKTYDGFLERLGKLLDANTCRRFDTLVEQQLYAYGKQYHDANLRYYLAFQVRAPSTGALRLAVRQMQLPVSPFSDFLQTLSRNTQLPNLPPPPPKAKDDKDDKAEKDGKDGESAGEEGATRAEPGGKDGEGTDGKPAAPRRTRLDPVLARMDRFKPIQSLSKTVADGVSELDKYKQILGLIQSRLEGGSADEGAATAAALGAGASPAEPAPEPSKEQAEAELAFREQLSPAGAMGLDILQRGRDSYLALTRGWLESVGLRGDMRRPFLRPIYELYKLGLQDMEANIADNWERRVYARAKPFLTRFPFSPRQSADVNPLELSETFKPGGTFWLDFDRLILPVLRGRRGEWSARRSIIRPMRLPRDLLTVSNRLDRLARTLWDEAGEPKPLELGVTPGLLADAAAENRPAIVLSFLSAGGSSVFGFNQKPYRQTLKVSWWERETSAVGLRLIDREEERDFYLRERSTNRLWSLWRLLGRGEELRSGDYTWNVAEAAGARRLARFRFADHPWRLFRIEDPNSSPDR